MRDAVQMHAWGGGYMLQRALVLVVTTIYTAVATCIVLSSVTTIMQLN